MNPKLAQMLQEINDASAKMVADTIASGQVQMLSRHGFATESEALASLPPGSVFQAVRNIAGRWVLA